MPDSHNDHSGDHDHAPVQPGASRIKVPYSSNPIHVAEGYKPPVVSDRSFEYETSSENAAYWQDLPLAYRQHLKNEADNRSVDLRLLLDERRSGAFQCDGCGKPMVMRVLFADGDRVYQCLNGACVKRIIRYQYQTATGRIIEVA